MFDFDAGKLIIVGVIALIFIPTKDLPRVLRQVGQFVGKMRRLAAEFQGQFMDAMREADVADMRQEARKLSDAARVSTGLDAMHGLDRHMTSSLDAGPATAPAPRSIEALAPRSRPSASPDPAAQVSGEPTTGAAETRPTRPALDPTHSEA